MGKTMILAEKPDAAKKMAEAYQYKTRDGYYEIEKCKTFPYGAYVCFAIGHLVALSTPEYYSEKLKLWKLEDLPFIPDVFKYNIIQGKSKAFNTIKKIANDPSVTELVIGTDAGREGELIAVSILKLVGVYGKKPIKRLWVSSMTPDAFRKGFENLKDGSETVNYYHESYARSICDYLVGINMTRALTIHLQKTGLKGVFSVGRVQTPVLKIIVDREREIETFVSKPYWTVIAQFNMNGKTYQGKWYRQEKEEKVENFFKKTDAEQILKSCLNQQALVQDVVKERKSIQPPRLHSLSSLQTFVGKKFKYTPSETLDIAQSLYTKGFLSYPRTDSNAITKEEAKQFPMIFNKLSQFKEYSSLLPTPIESNNLSKRYIDPSRVSDHYAIIPTEQVPDLSKLSQKEKNIYDVIVRSVIAAHYDDAVFDHTSIVTVVSNETFSTRGKVLVNEGWRKVIFPSGKEDVEDESIEVDDDDSLIPDLTKGEQGITRRVDLKEGKTTPKPRLSASNLINVMKYPAKFVESGDLLEDELEGEMASMAIGTEATRAGIIDTLIAREFIEVKKSKVYATEKGKILIDALGTNTLLCSPVLTAKWEAVLSKIGKGQYDSKTFIENGKKLTESLITNLNTRSKEWDFSNQISRIEEKDIVGTCPLCGSNIVNKGKFYGCSGYSEKGCKFNISQTIAKKKIPITQIKKFIKNKKTDLIKGFTSSKGKPFDAFLIWNDETEKVEWGTTKNKVTETSYTCPFCQNKLLDRETFIGCSGYSTSNCRFILPKVSFEKTLSDQNLRDLLEKGKTEVMEGFKGKYGPMTGSLFIDNEERKVKFKVFKN